MATATQWFGGKRGVILGLAMVCAASAAQAATINTAEYRDKVYACWLGKNIGGTLGVPFEGKREAQNVSFYTNLKPGEPAANDDLDLQLLWLKALEDHGGRVDARILGEYWLKYVPVDWNEYGVGKKNMKAGLLPPLSGEFENEQWKHSNGAWIRTEIWACLAPGDPMRAARMAREDACVDHGAAEGTLAAMFVAALESAAFVETDRDALLAVGLAAIPADCRVARAVRTAMDARKQGKDWAAAREAVVVATEDTGWFQAPRNVAFTILGWLYGDGDFGKSICAAINCGDDTDCTGATLGSILGIIGGTQGIPKNWSEPIGTKINMIAVEGCRLPATLDELTEHTVAMAVQLTGGKDAPLSVRDAKTDLAGLDRARFVVPEELKKTWELSPYRITWDDTAVNAVFDYGKAPYITAGEPAACTVLVTNKTKTPQPLSTAIMGVPVGWVISGLPENPTRLEADRSVTFQLAATSPLVEATPYRMRLGLTLGTENTVWIPFAFVGKPVSVSENFALASAGATATADSELDREPGCAAKVIDGIIATNKDFGNRWHSSVATPHPHWIQVTLPETKTVGQVVIHFADPKGRPIDFAGYGRSAADKEWVRLFAYKSYSGVQNYETSVAPISVKEFRFEITASSSAAYPNAAQISEIQLFPPRR